MFGRASLLGPTQYIRSLHLSNTDKLVFLPIVFLCMFTSGALGELVVFDNSNGVFDWGYTGRLPDASSLSNTARGPLLSVILPDHEQSEDVTIPQAWQQVRVWTPNDTPGLSRFFGSRTRFVSRDITRTERSTSFEHEFTISAMHHQGTLVVGPNLNWANRVQFAHIGGGPFQPPSEVFVEDGVLGLELTLDDGIHYGFMDLTFSNSENYGGMEAIPIRWGYETVVGQPVVIPTPGSGALLICAIVVLKSRRRLGV